MANSSSRSVQAEAASVNKQGIVLPPDDLSDATSALDDAFKNVMGRDPSIDDNTAVQDRDNKDEGEDNPDLALHSSLEPVADDLLKDDDQKSAEGEGQKSADDEEPKATDGEEQKSTEGEEQKTADDEGSDDLIDQLLDRKKDDAPAKEADPFEDIKLRSDASERTKETFAELKRRAKEREEAAKNEALAHKQALEEAKKQLEEAQGKLSKLSPEIESELKELREFRATFDLERDPEFRQKFDSRKEANDRAVFEVLKKNGLKDELIEAVKKLDDEEQVNQIARWAEKLSPRDKLFITGKLADNETVAADRQKALAEAKSRADQLLSEQRSASEKSQETFVAEVVSTLKPVLKELPFLHPKDVPSNATPKEKAEVEKHNAEAAKAQAMLLAFIEDDSPRTRSSLALAGVLAPRFRAEANSLRQELTALRKELDSIKNAGRLSRTSHSSGTAEKAAPMVDIFETGAEEAIEKAWEAMQ